MDVLHRIGVIADTHDRWIPRVAELFADVDEVWHLGDICKESTLDPLRALGCPLSVVLGNNDASYLGYPLTLELKRHGETFHLVHIPPRRIDVLTGWLLHGHTHVPRDERVNGVRVFNPGSAGRATKGAPLSVGFLTKRGDAPYEAEIVLL
jgi:putative phosphoesterase